MEVFLFFFFFFWYHIDEHEQGVKHEGDMAADACQAPIPQAFMLISQLVNLKNCSIWPCSCINSTFSEDIMMRSLTSWHHDEITIFSSRGIKACLQWQWAAAMETYWNWREKGKPTPRCWWACLAMQSRLSLDRLPNTPSSIVAPSLAMVRIFTTANSLTGY